MIQRKKADLRPILLTCIILLLLALLPLSAAGETQSNASAPSGAQETASDVKLPVGKDTFKIEVNKDGLYAITGQDLADAGMNLASVTPNSIQMMHRGQAVAYQFINVDGSPGFGTTDQIRFYGWQFDGSRYEDMYVNNNVFWLWAGGTASQVQSVPNNAGKGYPKVTEFEESITKWPHNNYFPGWQVDWDLAPNEATSWYWERVRQFPGTPGVTNLPIDLPNPASGTNKTGKILVEVTSRYKSLEDLPTSFVGEVSLNQNASSTTETWNNGVNLNIVHEAPTSQFLKPGAGSYPTNQVNFELLTSSGDPSSRSVVYITRVTVDYPRELVAVSDELIFGSKKAGNHEFQIEGFSAAAAGKVIVWDISDKYKPAQIEVSANQQSATAATVVVGRSHDADAQFIATTTDNLQSALAISKYVPKELTPPKKAGSWVAVSHKSLLSAAQDLAQYRAARSEISTWVVDVEDVANQVGYGFNTPLAIREYLREARATWSEVPVYLTIFGDATVNPRQLECLAGCGEWDAGKPTLVPTDLPFVDRFNGQIPVDYTFGLLEGDDLYAEVAVGRVPAATLAEAQAVVQKIKLYEGSFDNIQAWHKQMLFIADNADQGGAFCTESKQTATHVPNSFEKTFLCLPTTSDEAVLEQATADLREELFTQINDNGMAIMNYRGHGGISGWASPSIMTTDDTAFWQNVGRPLVLLSADCLDGNFASTVREGLGETFIKLDNSRGTAAHWSSSGLGYAFEHSVLHDAFFDAVFKLGVSGIGDAINYAKTTYLADGYDESEAYAFTLLGDPAMITYPTNATVNLPVVLRP